MAPDKRRLGEICTWALVLCAIITTGLVVRREISSVPPTGAPTMQWEATYVGGWQEALVVGIRSGSTDAPVQIIEFADFECPYCAHFESTIQAVRDKYPDQVAFTFAHFPLIQHSFAEKAARMAECAHAQGRFDEMRAILFDKSEDFGSIPWSDFAEQAAVSDLSQFNACTKQAETLARVQESKKLGERIGISGTPGIIVNGWKFPVPPSTEDFDQIVENVMTGRSPAAEINFRR